MSGPADPSLGSVDLANVKVHGSQSKSDALGAHAYGRGADMHFSPGTYRPGSGQRLLGHELTHVVQQRQGQVAVGGAMKDTLKRHAEAK